MGAIGEHLQQVGQRLVRGSAQVRELETKPQRIRRDQAEKLREALLPFEQEMPEQVRALIGLVDRQTSARNKWTFIMLSPEQNAAVVNYLCANSARPLVAVQLWALLFQNLRTDTGEVLLRRDEIAEALKQKPDTISELMGELERFGAISRIRERVGGMRGPGLVRYFMNPRVATHLGGIERERAQDDAPLLKLIEGGKSDEI
jgi:hypothetical protein